MQIGTAMKWYEHDESLKYITSQLARRVIVARRMRPAAV
jgi:hypothetical protein